jgi:hypothetical protein
MGGEPHICGLMSEQLTKSEVGLRPSARSKDCSEVVRNIHFRSTVDVRYALARPLSVCGEVNNLLKQANASPKFSPEP